MLADFKYALRSLLKGPTYYAMVILILGLGIGVTVSVFSLVDGVVFRPLPYRDSGRLVALQSIATKPPFDANGSFTYEDFEQLQAHSQTLQDLSVMYRVGWSEVALTNADQTEKLRGGFVSPNFFALLGRAPVVGRVFSQEEATQGAHVLLVSEPFAQRRFGSAENALHREIQTASAKWRIIGVMPADFRVPFLDSQLWAPVTSHPVWEDRAEPNSRQQATRWDLMARLKPGVSQAAAQAELDVLYRGLRDKGPDWHNDRALVVPLRDHFTSDSRKPFAILSASVGLLLLIACANVSNLLLARAASRQREFAVRAAMGAGIGRLLRQAIMETTSICVIAGALGVGLSLWLVKLLKMSVRHTPRVEDVSVNARVLLFSIALTLAMGVILGLTSVWSGMRRNVSQPLRSATRSATGGTRQKSVLVVCEFALAMMLLTGSALLIRSFVAVLKIDPGFRPEHLLTLRVEAPSQMAPAQLTQFYADAMQRIRNIPGIQAVGAVNWVFQGPSRTHSLRSVEGHETEPVEKWDSLEWSRVSGDYFQAMGIPLLHGRFFEAHDGPSAPPVVIVNETLARRYWPGENPVGKRVKGWDPRGKNDEWVTVVGVVKDIRGGGRERKPFGQIYEVQAQQTEQTALVVVRASGDPAQATSEVRAAIHDANPSVGVALVKTMEQVLAEQEAPRQFETWVVSLFSAAALALAALGIFAVMHFNVAARTREIGIRMAVGAKAVDILRLVVGSGARLALVGIALGAFASIWITDVLGGMLFGIQPNDPWSFAAAALVLTTVALAACLFPALRAAHLDPLSALREE